MVSGAFDKDPDEFSHVVTPSTMSGKRRHSQLNRFLSWQFIKAHCGQYDEKTTETIELLTRLQLCARTQMSTRMQCIYPS